MTLQPYAAADVRGRWRRASQVRRLFYLSAGGTGDGLVDASHDAQASAVSAGAGRRVVRAASGARADGAAAWLSASDATGERHLAIVSADGTEFTNVGCVHRTVGQGTADWSPDGESIRDERPTTGRVRACS